MRSYIAAFNRTAFFWNIRFYFWKAKKLLLMWAKCYNRGFEFTKGLIFFLCAVVPPRCWLTYTTYISLDSILVHTHVSVSAGERFPLRLELMRVEPRSSRSVKRGPPRTDNDMGEEIIRFNFPTLSQMLTGKNYLVFISRQIEAKESSAKNPDWLPQSEVRRIKYVKVLWKVKFKVGPKQTNIKSFLLLSVFFYCLLVR